MSGHDIKRAEIVHDLAFLRMLVERSSVEWLVIHTNPNCERRAHEALVGAGILSYLPVECIERQHRPTGKKYTVKKPLFSRYLFVGLDRNKGENVDQVRACDGVKGIVSMTENGRPVRVSTGDLLNVIDVAHGTFEGKPVPDGLMARIARLQEGGTLYLVKGCWKGMDFTFTGYDEAKKQVKGEMAGKKLRVPVDAVDPNSLPIDAG